jgi:hypothetical protein
MIERYEFYFMRRSPAYLRLQKKFVLGGIICSSYTCGNPTIISLRLTEMVGIAATLCTGEIFGSNL